MCHQPILPVKIHTGTSQPHGEAGSSPVRTEHRVVLEGLLETQLRSLHQLAVGPQEVTHPSDLHSSLQNEDKNDIS